MATNPNLNSLNRVRFAGLDFDTHQDDLRSQLQVKFAAVFNDFAVSSLGIMLIDTFAFGLDTLSFYLDRRATDLYLATARTRGAVSLLSRQLGYKMAGATAAIVDLAVNPSQAYAFAIPIPQRFQFQGPNGLIFEAAQTVTFPISSTTSQVVPCYQGETQSETFTSDGSVNQIFQLSRVPTSQFVVFGSVQVTVDGGSWDENDFITFDASNQFEVGYNDEPPTVRFGNALAGNIPPVGSSIVVTYVTTMAQSGQVTAADAITSSVTPLVVLANTINLTINNPKGTQGGTDPESLDETKRSAPLVFKSRRVAVTRPDYEALAGAFVDPLFGRVAVAQAIAARSASSDLTLQSLLNSILSAVSIAQTSIATAITAPTTGADDYISSIATASTTIQSKLTAAGQLSDKLVAIDTQMDTIRANDLTIKNTSATITSAKASADAVAATISGIISPIPPTALVGVDQLTTVTKNSLTNALTNLLAYLSNIGTANTSLIGAEGSIETARTAIGRADFPVLTGLLGGIGSLVTDDPSLLLDIQTNLTAISNAVVSTALPQRMVDITTAADFGSVTIAEDTSAIFDHVDQFLSADCKANLVVVPILTRNASGFYDAPSEGLRQALETYLTGIKEVTQTVSVTSGAAFLVPAVISVTVYISSGISDTVTKATIRTIVEGLLRDKPFGESLYLSDLVTPINEITGVVYTNLTINGYRPLGATTISTDKLIDGNLIVKATEVVTLSTDTNYPTDLSIAANTFIPVTS